MTEPQPLVRQLLAERKQRGYTQTDVAQRAGLSKTYVSEMESGTRRPSIITVAAYARAVGLNLTLTAEPVVHLPECVVCHQPWPCAHAASRT